MAIDTHQHRSLLYIEWIQLTWKYREKKTLLEFNIEKYLQIDLVCIQMITKTCSIQCE